MNILQSADLRKGNELLEKLVTARTHHGCDLCHLAKVGRILEILLANTVFLFILQSHHGSEELPKNLILLVILEFARKNRSLELCAARQRLPDGYRYATSSPQPTCTILLPMASLHSGGKQTHLSGIHQSAY